MLWRPPPPAHIHLACLHRRARHCRRTAPLRRANRDIECRSCGVAATAPASHAPPPTGPCSSGGACRGRHVAGRWHSGAGTARGLDRRAAPSTAPMHAADAHAPGAYRCHIPPGALVLPRLSPAARVASVLFTGPFWQRPSTCRRRRLLRTPRCRSAAILGGEVPFVVCVGDRNHRRRVSVSVVRRRARRSWSMRAEPESTQQRQKNR